MLDNIDQLFDHLTELLRQELVSLQQFNTRDFEHNIGIKDSLLKQIGDQIATIPSEYITLSLKDHWYRQLQTVTDLSQQVQKKFNLICTAQRQYIRRIQNNFIDTQKSIPKYTAAGHKTKGNILAHSVRPFSVEHRI